jgi:DNA polymerase I-like protein with 3'-5' exonuclease and polymerase domains
MAVPDIWRGFMKAPILIAMLLATAFLSGAVQAQTKPEPAKKLYRWVDKNGKTQISDTLPPELAGQARKELSAKSGTATSSVDRALTEEERAVQSVKNEQDAAVAKAAADQKRLEEAMLVSYQSESEVTRVYKERIDLLQQTIESTDISIKSIRGSLAGMLSQAAERELKKREVEAKDVESIKELHEELLKQQATQINRRVDIKSLEGEYQKVLARYRDLRGAADAADAAAAAGNQPAAPANTPVATPGK